jgi:nitric oxide reductase subunit B
MVSKGIKTFFIVGIVGAIIVALIGYFYTEKDLPPYPGKVVSEVGTTLTGKSQIMAGQGVWQKYGLMDLGSVWGHGTYRGPDFTAQALHNMTVVMRDVYAKKRYGIPYDSLDTEKAGATDAVVIKQIKTNGYEKASDTLTLTNLQEKALIENRKFYNDLFTKGETEGPIQAETIKDSQERQNVADFFFWTAWCAGTLRPGDNHTYTNNWPHDPQAGNFVSGKSLVWSAISLVAFGLFLGLIIFIFHKYQFNKGATPYSPQPAQSLAEAKISSSQRKTAKYFFCCRRTVFCSGEYGRINGQLHHRPPIFLWAHFYFKFLFI